MYETLADALAGTEAPPEITSELALITVPYVDFGGSFQTGQLVTHHELCEELQNIFEALYTLRFPMQRITPVIAYNWNDEASMVDNNTSAFNYRKIIGTERLSNHSYGRAIDINPLLNPYYAANGKVYPEGATYDPSKKGTVTDEAVNLFKEHGWEWGGDWSDRKDYQHFQKP